MEKSFNQRLDDYQKALKNLKDFEFNNKGNERGYAYRNGHDVLLRRAQSYERELKAFGIGTLWQITGERWVDLNIMGSDTKSLEPFVMYMVGVNEVDLALFLETLVKNKTHNIDPKTLSYKSIKTREMLDPTKFH
jgi:hypothetical protein